MKIKAIFYDFDGVIKDSTEVKTKAFYQLYLPYGKSIADKVVVHHLQNGGVSRFKKIQYYHSEFLKIQLTDEEINKLANQFSEIVLEQVIACNYVKGANDVIHELKDKYLQFIVTGTPQNEIEYISEELKITNCFKEIFGSPTTKIEIVKNLLAKYNFKSHEVIFIGDALTDYEAALKYNLNFILRTHIENEEIFKDYKGVKINDFEGFHEVLNKFNL